MLCVMHAHSPLWGSTQVYRSCAEMVAQNSPSLCAAYNHYVQPETLIFQKLRVCIDLHGNE